MLTPMLPYLTGILKMTPEPAWIFAVSLAPCKAEAQFGQLPSPRAARTVVGGLIWPFSLAFGRTPPSVALERMTIGGLTQAERSNVLVKRIVMENDAPFLPLVVERQKGETQLFVKEVKVEGKRYIVCRNEAEAEKDRKDREAIVTALDAQLKKGDKALVGNSAYRRYLRKTPEMKHRPAFEIDPGKLAQEARFDGIFVLRTNAKITPLQAVLRYRDLLQVENLFLRTKAVMRTRPIFHSSDAAIRGMYFVRS